MSGSVCQSPDWRVCCEDCRHVTPAGVCRWLPRQRHGVALRDGMIVCGQYEVCTDGALRAELDEVCRLLHLPRGTTRGVARRLDQVLGLKAWADGGG